uniref:Uncharacterized protein n=1 Tax=Arundo donax TaxID=35708 RepID=A0A0A9U3I9_ARUDO
MKLPLPKSAKPSQTQCTELKCKGPPN